VKVLKFFSAALLLFAAPANAQVYNCTFDEKWTESDGYTPADKVVGFERSGGDCGPYSILVHLDGKRFPSCYQEWENRAFVVTLPLDEGLWTWTTFEDLTSRLTIASTTEKSIRFYSGKCEDRN
jgi:hypothetical protein